MTDQIQAEDWRPIRGFEGLYEITATERVRSVDRFIEQPNRWGGRQAYFHRGRELKPYIPKRGPKQVVLFDKEHRRHCRTISSLVAETFGMTKSRCSRNQPHNSKGTHSMTTTTSRVPLCTGCGRELTGDFLALAHATERADTFNVGAFFCPGCEKRHAAWIERELGPDGHATDSFRFPAELVAAEADGSKDIREPH